MNHQLERKKRSIIELLRRHDVKRASFFGSTVTGKGSRKSDIDLLVEFEGTKSLLDLAGLKIDLEELLGKSVDVLTFKSLHPLLKERILLQQDVLI